MAQLMAHPEHMKRAREELEAVVGRDRLMQEPDLPNLPFLQAIVKESFRLASRGASGDSSDIKPGSRCLRIQDSRFLETPYQHTCHPS